jgi:hypothetical protein
LARNDLHAGLVGDEVGETLGAVIGRRRAGRAFQLDDLGVAAHGLVEPFGGAAALLDEVGADESHIIFAGLGQARIDVAVEQDDGNAGAFGVHHRRDQRLFLARGQEDRINALGDHGIDVGNLLGGGAGRVGVDELPAALGRLVLHALGLGDAPGIVALVWAKPTR